MCAYNVPGVCTYFFDKYILKYGIRAFQRCVARLSTTKTRCYESISILGTLIRQLSRLVSRDEVPSICGFAADARHREWSKKSKLGKSNYWLTLRNLQQVTRWVAAAATCNASSVSCFPVHSSWALRAISCFCLCFCKCSLSSCFTFSCTSRPRAFAVRI